MVDTSEISLIMKLGQCLKIINISVWDSLSPPFFLMQPRLAAIQLLDCPGGCKDMKLAES
jgi:hypothetical protein